MIRGAHMYTASRSVLKRPDVTAWSRLPWSQYSAPSHAALSHDHAFLQGQTWSARGKHSTQAEVTLTAQNSEVRRNRSREYLNRVASQHSNLWLPGQLPRRLCRAGIASTKHQPSLHVRKNRVCNKG